MALTASLSLQSWLQDSHSFIDRLKAQGLQPDICVLDERFEYAQPNEAKLLEIAETERVFVREVLIYHGEEKLMFARTVIPEETLTGKEEELQYLGNRSLGSVLFSYSDVERSAFELFLANLPQYSCAPLWGRQSLFYFHQKRLLLKEFYLPDFEARYA